MSKPTKYSNVKKVKIRRAEGYKTDPEVGQWIEFDTIEEANAKLHQNALNSSVSPKHPQAYDKHDFEVQFKNGFTYTGRYDLHRNEYGNIEGQMEKFCKHQLKHENPNLTPQEQKSIRDDSEECLTLLGLHVEHDIENPTSAKWSKGVDLKEGELTKHGWGKWSNEPERHKALKASVREDGYVTTRQRLQYLENITEDKATKSIANQDGMWMQANRDELKGLKPSKAGSKKRSEKWVNRYKVYLQRKREGRVHKESVFTKAQNPEHAKSIATSKMHGYSVTQVREIHPKPKRIISRGK